MRIIAIVQARMSSSRLPGKVLLKLCDKTTISNIFDRLSRSKRIDSIVIATSSNEDDDLIEKECLNNNINVFRGSLNNVLERFFCCASFYKADIIVRCTADNPFVDPALVDEAIAMFEKKHLDYLSYKKRLPLGMAVEVFSFNALSKAFNEATNNECLEHVTPYIAKNPQLFHSLRFDSAEDIDYSDIRLTMDTPEDYAFASTIYNFFGSNIFSYKDLICAITSHPEWRIMNKTIKQKVVEYQGEDDKC